LSQAYSPFLSVIRRNLANTSNLLLSCAVPPPSFPTAYRILPSGYCILPPAFRLSHSLCSLCSPRDIQSSKVTRKSSIAPCPMLYALCPMLHYGPSIYILIMSFTSCSVALPALKSLIFLSISSLFTLGLLKSI